MAASDSDEEAQAFWEEFLCEEDEGELGSGNESRLCLSGVWGGGGVGGRRACRGGGRGRGV